LNSKKRRKKGEKKKKKKGLDWTFNCRYDPDHELGRHPDDHFD